MSFLVHWPNHYLAQEVENHPKGDLAAELKYATNFIDPSPETSLDIRSQSTVTILTDNHAPISDGDGEFSISGVALVVRRFTSVATNEIIANLSVAVRVEFQASSKGGEAYILPSESRYFIQTF